MFPPLRENDEFEPRSRECESWRGGLKRDVFLWLNSADHQGVPWGAWLDRNKLFAIFGGSLKERTETGWEENISDARALGEEHLVWSVSLGRFSAAEDELRHDPSPFVWNAWGKQGVMWWPEWTLVLDLETKEGYFGRQRSLGRSLGDQDQVASPLLHLFEQSFGGSLRAGELISVEGIHESRTTLDPSGSMGIQPTSMEERARWDERLLDLRDRCLLGEFDKVVTARALSVTAPRGRRWSPAQLFMRCCEEEAARGSVPFALCPDPMEAFIGISPEQLFSLKNGLLETHALAGTRSSLREGGFEDAISSLCQSEKDREEHQLVVDYLRDALERICDEIKVGERGIRRASHLVHLETRLEGKLAEGRSEIDLIDALHPTPALGGLPRRSALTYLLREEPLCRGGYGAPWGWKLGSGDVKVMIGIRSALLMGNEAYLFAGAGVVSGSTPEGEWIETGEKSQVIGRLLTFDQTVEDRGWIAERGQFSALRLVEQLKAEGIGGAVISPGSRSTPISLALSASLPTLISVDERSAAFTALGWAKSSGSPIALCCTSGSAGAHYYPAVIEAHHAGVPLIILTADRPPRLRGCGAPQTIDQTELFNRHIKHYEEAPVDPLTSDESRVTLHEWGAQWAEAGTRSIKNARSYPQGVAHLNLPLEEPLWNPRCDALVKAWQERSSCLYTRETRASSSHDLSPVEIPAELDLSTIKGVIYCGPCSPRAAQILRPLLQRLSRECGWPLLAEGSSQFRGTPLGLSSFDEFTRSDQRHLTLEPRGAPEAEEVQLIIHIGAHTHSRSVRAWMERASQAQQFWTGEGPELVDPLAQGIISLGPICHSLVQALKQKLKRVSADLSATKSSRQEWLERWNTLDQRINLCAKRLFSRLSREEDRLWGGAIGYALAKRAELIGELVVASSMAFRDHDLTWGKALNSQDREKETWANVWVNRGVNGIDGTCSTALGIGIGSATLKPLIVWLGDLATFHDVQGLHRLAEWATHHERTVVVLMVNNEGGGIFYHLPIREGAQFNRVFKTPLMREGALVGQEGQSRWRGLADWVGAHYIRACNVHELEVSLTQAMSTPTITLLEAIVDASEDHQLHQAYWSAVLRAEWDQAQEVTLNGEEA